MDEDKALNFLLKYVDEAEIYYSCEISHRLTLKKGEFDVYEWDRSEGYGVRVIKDKKMGFAFSNKLEKDVLHRAIKTSRISEKDENLALPEKQRYRVFNSGYDIKIKTLELEDVIGFAEEMIEPCLRRHLNPSKAGVSWSIGREKIVNSLGIDAEEKETYCSCNITAVAKNTETATATEYAASRRLDLDFESVGEGAASLAKRSLGAKKMAGGVFNLVLRPNAAAELLEEVLAPSFSGENVIRGRSVLSGRVGEELFSPELNLIDDGTLKMGLNTSAFDSEGVATQKTWLVEKGVLRGFLFDTFYANMAGEKSTGNALRTSYSTIPGVGVSNLVVRGSGGLDENELVVHGLMGTHTANTVSGDFSLETRNAFFKGNPVKKLIITGNIFDLLKNITGFGDDYKQVSSVLTPSIEFSDVKVAG